MSKPFNLEEAKAGKPFAGLSLGKIISKEPKRIIGTDKHGYIVWEFASTNTVGIYVNDPHDLQMLSEKKSKDFLLIQNVAAGRVIARLDNADSHNALKVCPGTYKVIKKFTVEWEE